MAKVTIFGCLTKSQLNQIKVGYKLAIQRFTFCSNIFANFGSKEMGSRKLNNDQLLNILALSKDATAVYTGEQLIIETANDAMIAFWGKDRSVIGQSFIEAVPELVGQPFFDLLRDVWRTGVTYEAVDTAAQLRVDGRSQWFYYDFIYRAIKNEKGEV